MKELPRVVQGKRERLLLSINYMFKNINNNSNNCGNS